MLLPSHNVLICVIYSVDTTCMYKFLTTLRNGFYVTRQKYEITQCFKWMLNLFPVN